MQHPPENHLSRDGRNHAALQPTENLLVELPSGHRDHINRRVIYSPFQTMQDVVLPEERLGNLPDFIGYGQHGTKPNEV